MMSSQVGPLTVALVATILLATRCVSQSGIESSGVPYPTTTVPSVSSSVPYEAKPVPASGAPFNAKPVPPVVEVTAPFSLNSSPSAAANAIEYRSEEIMTAADRDLVTTAAPTIEGTATLAGFDLGTGKWSFQQLVCHALPDHIFLLYNRNNGADDVSLFSAAISRSGHDRARIIPIQRRGFSPYSPAPVNPITIAEFNRIRDAEPAKNSADWLATGLCYAALAGAHPESSPLAQKTSGGGLALSFPPILEIGSLGQATVRFDDFAATPQPMQWALKFNSNGRLLAVDHFATPAFAITPISSAADQHSPVPTGP
jgi:hypothetical protein